MTEQESRRGKTRRERVEFARSRDILDVANELQMELVRSGRDYRWKEHDSLVISPDKNLSLNSLAVNSFPNTKK